MRALHFPARPGGAALCCRIVSIPRWHARSCPRLTPPSLPLPARRVAELVNRYRVGKGGAWLESWEGTWQATLDACLDGVCHIHPT